MIFCLGRISGVAHRYQDFPVQDFFHLSYYTRRRAHYACIEGRRAWIFLSRLSFFPKIPRTKRGECVSILHTRSPRKQLTRTRAIYPFGTLFGNSKVGLWRRNCFILRHGITEAVDGVLHEVGYDPTIEKSFNGYCFIDISDGFVTPAELCFASPVSSLREYERAFGRTRWHFALLSFPQRYNYRGSLRVLLKIGIWLYWLAGRYPLFFSLFR